MKKRGTGDAQHVAVVSPQCMLPQKGGSPVVLHKRCLWHGRAVKGMSWSAVAVRDCSAARRRTRCTRGRGCEGCGHQSRHRENHPLPSHPGKKEKREEIELDTAHWKNIASRFILAPEGDDLEPSAQSRARCSSLSLGSHDFFVYEVHLRSEKASAAKNTRRRRRAT